MICRCKVTPACFLLQRKCRMRKLSISIVRPLQASQGLVYQCLQPGHDQSWRLSEGNNARDKRPVVVNGNKKGCPFHQFGEKLVLGRCLALSKWETSRLLYLLRGFNLNFGKFCRKLMYFYISRHNLGFDGITVCFKIKIKPKL